MEAVQVRPPHPPDSATEGTQTTSDFVECYLMHYRRLVRALRLGGADPATAEDVAQEAFARALARWRRVRKGVNPPGYVYTTGFRLLQRSQRRSATTQAGGVPEAAVGAPGVDAAATFSVALEDALAQMPPKRRACAVMCLVVGMSVHEAGEALSIADGTVRKHLDEAKRDLRVAWHPDG
jgi:RNA polymerase sigma-70 factor (ECF subfamily)